MDTFSQPDLKYLPLTKYDNVSEHFDGSITINEHYKQRFLFTANNNEKIFIMDALRGCLYRYIPENGSLLFLPLKDRHLLVGAIGLAINETHLFSFIPSLKSMALIKTETLEISLVPFLYSPNALFADKEFLWFIENDTRKLFRLSKNLQGNPDFLFECKGIGDLAFIAEPERILVTDNEENILRAYSQNGKISFEVITPYIDPIGIIRQNTNYEILYGGLISEVSYENRCWQEQKAFFHPIKWNIIEEKNAVITVSNTFVSEIIYEEHFTKIPDESCFPLEVQISIPLSNEYQRCIDIFPLGYPFSICETINGSCAVFTISSKALCPPAIGFKARLFTRSRKIFFPDAEKALISHQNLLLPAELDELDTESNILKQAAQITWPVCDWTKVKILRERIFAQLRYQKNTRAASFEEVWNDGYGTCGDYTSLMLNFFHQHRICSQSVGGFKIPRFSNAVGEMRSAYYNHAWAEIISENGERIPVESSSDDKTNGTNFSEAQLGGLDWTHIRMYSGKAVPGMIKIKSPQYLHPFDIFKNAVFFKVLGEIPIDQF